MLLCVPRRTTINAELAEFAESYWVLRGLRRTTIDAELAEFADHDLLCVFRVLR